jgi:oligopeptide/dipeptide ABC transporter ATP-binding protein
MRQRIIIAIALALQPRLLIADEPTTALDVTIQAQVLDLLRRLTAERGTSLLLITHDLGIVAELAERVYVMYAGTIAESATTLELFDHPRHPYTLGLLQSLPRLDQPRGLRLIPIEGTPPSLSATPIGCPFAPRCSRRLDVCTTTTPPLVAAGADAQASGHWFACHNPVGANEPSA